MKYRYTFFSRLAALMLSVLILGALLVSCNSGNEKNPGDTTEEQTQATTEKAEKMDLSDMDLSPYIALGQYKNIPVTMKEIEYVVALREILLEDGAYLEKMKEGEIDRPVMEGDIIHVDYTGYLDGVQFDGGRATNQDITVYDGKGYIDGFASGFIGAEVGETSSFDVTFPKDYSEASLAGKEVTFEFKVHHIYQFDELTDEMAVDLSNGEFTTAEAYEQHQRNLLIQEKLWLTIVDNATVIKYPEQHRLYYYQQNRSYYDYYASLYQMTYEKLLAALDLTDAALWKSAELYVLEDLVYYAIRSAENIALTEEEYNEKIDVYINRYKEELKYSDAEIRENMAAIEDNMLYDKVQEMLIEWADVTWEPLEDGASAEE